ncbi:MAG: Glycosyltransferase [Parcubacteria group bacterium Gr01-1014_56]|nr:MAG: Glycosyltransferase [Parcubacteria group bacterium Gr01-1014_56]
MRIAITTDQYLPMLSGLVDSVDTLANELRRQGHEVRVYAPALPGSKPEKNVFHFPSLALPGSGGGVILSFPFGALKDMRAFKPEIIHTHLFGVAGLLAWVSARRFKIPLVGTDHTSPADYLHYFYLNFQPFIYIVRALSSWFYSLSTSVTAPSQHILDELYDYGMKRTPMEVISNPILTNLFRPLSNKQELKSKYGVGRQAVLLFGRVAVEKNLEFAAEIFTELAKTSDAQLVVVGDGPYRKELEEKVARLGIKDKTKFLGILRGEALVEALNAAEVLLVTSTSEIQPMTVLQAMSAGLPVVGARAGGIPECVIDGDTGYLVDPTKSQEYVKKLTELLDDQLLRENFGRAGRKVVEAYSPEQITKRFLNVYQKAIGLHSK